MTIQEIPHIMHDYRAYITIELREDSDTTLLFTCSESDFCWRMNVNESWFVEFVRDMRLHVARHLSSTLPEKQ